MTFLTSYSNLTSNISNVNVGNVSGNSTLGAPSQLKITGGANGYLVQTDGQGNLQWSDPNPNITPVGANGTIQFNNLSSFGGSNTFTFDVANTTLYANSTLTTANVVVPGSTTLARPPQFTDGFAGQIVTTNGNGGLQWNFGGNGINYTTGISNLSSNTTATANLGANSITVSPPVSLVANNVVSFATAPYEYYEVASTNTVGNSTTITFDNVLVNTIPSSTELLQVNLTTVSSIALTGALQSNALLTTGTARTLGDKLYITDTFNPGPAGPGSPLMFNLNSQFTSNANAYYNTSNVLSVGNLTTNTLLVRGTLNLNNTLTTTNSVLSFAADIPTISIANNFTVDNMLVTPYQTANVALSGGTTDISIQYGGTVVPFRTNTEVGGFNHFNFNNANLTYNGNGRFYNYTGSTMILLVSWFVTWNLNPTVTDDTDKNARNTWLAIDGDITNNRYGMLGQDNTGFQYRVPSNYFQLSWWGPTGQASQAIIKLQPNSYFSIWMWHNAASGAYTNTVFWPGGGGATTDQGPTFYAYHPQAPGASAKLEAVRLDS